MWGEAMTARICGKCGLRKPPEEFYRAPSNGDGIHRWCKVCVLAQHAAYRRTPHGREVVRRGTAAYAKTERGKKICRASAAKCAKSDKGRARLRARLATPKGRAAQRDRLYRSRARYPGRYACRIATNHAIRAGELVRGVCEKCGEPDAHAHHDDYSKPLEVRWLCRQHHEELHHTHA